ncbi:MAG: DUF938 domain-containing protein [Cognatishimia sp.]|uniref:DUF938 domain-containing protein n=1 Tax=Cognatishimia sp. TaxID=2211648 RepID=UPI003B8C7889
MVRETPKGASIAHSGEDARLFAPSAARNRDVLAELMAKVAPPSRDALEIASGTGQHIVAFAANCPDLLWHPTDVAKDRLSSIDAYVAEAGLTNVAPAQLLNATQSGWSQNFNDLSFVFLANLLHLISETEANTLITEAAQTLTPDGKLLIYGPFMRDGQLTSEGDARFHESLKEQDPEIGYKELSLVISWASEQKMAHIETHTMPANNLALEFVKTV